MKKIILILMLVLPNIVFAQNPIELGDVHWFRDLSLAQMAAKESGKPIFILFQEVPGCSTCRQYGEQIVSHPLVVDILENEFIPLAIYNNKGGDDKKVLELFDEPSWNNPVVRMVDHQLKSVVNRLHGVYTLKGVVNYIMLGLEERSRPIPQYFQLLHQSFVTESASLTFSMFCFWEGEAKLGALNGILSTEPGFVQGHEVVKVIFDPAKLSFASLIQAAKKQDCSKAIYAEEKDFSELKKTVAEVKSMDRFRADSDPQYYLKQTALKYVPMIPIQATKINSALAKNENINVYLSPRQIQIWDYYKKLPLKGDSQAYNTNDFYGAWKSVMKSLKIS